MHVSPQIGERHRDHHRRNEGQECQEFRDYLKGSFVVMAIMFSTQEAGIGWFWGTSCAFSAYAHQLQHENPLLDENAGALCASQIRYVASQLWSSRRLVGSCVWHLQACGMADRRKVNSRGVIGNFGGGK